MITNGHKHNLAQDLAIIVLSFLIAIIMVRAHVISDILGVASNLRLIGSFVAGTLFTSAFTVAPATIALVEIARGNSVVLTALLGALGAVFGDLIIFLFIKDRFAEDIAELIKKRGAWQKSKALFKSKILRTATVLMGFVIIASPLPDELGIGMLGFSKINPYLFATLSFLCNFIGILLIGFAAKTLF